MQNRRQGMQPTGPDEGHYDPREGAKGYAPIVASFGALAVTAIVVVFTLSAEEATLENLTLVTGLLAMAVFASFLAAFGLVAVGAERDPTANLPPTIMFLAIPVALAFLGTLGAFEVLAAMYVPESTFLFIIITGAGGAAAVVFSAFVVGDSWGMNPTTMTPAALGDWLKKQWIQTAGEGQRQSVILIMAGIIPILIAGGVRVADTPIEIGLTGINAIIIVGVTLTLLGTAVALFRARHPEMGNDQKGIRRWEAWSSTMTISIYTGWLLLTLPA